MGDYVGLVDARHRARYEHDEGVFIAEGHLAVQRLLASAYPVRSLLVARPRAERFAPLMAEAAGLSVSVFVAEPAVMAEVTGFDVHRGVLAVGVRCTDAVAGDLLARPGLLVAGEGLNDGQNMGALGRCAAAFGATGLLLDPTCCDPLSRRAVRVSLGHILGLPLSRARRWPDVLQDAGVEVLALTPQDHAVALGDYVASVAASPPRTIVVVVGSEGAGLLPETMARATQRIRIPMASGVDSLNVAAAAAVALSHLAALFP